MSDLDPKAMVDYLVKLGCLQEVETISVTVDINADSHVFQVEAREYNSVLDLKAKVQDRLGFPIGGVRCAMRERGRWPRCEWGGD